MFRVSARTILELGAELISSDIIAFYELVKNAFDARSSNGAEIHFQIVLRRNAYLALRTIATAPSAARTEGTVKSRLMMLTDEVRRHLEPTAKSELCDRLLSKLAATTSIDAFVTALDLAYKEINQIQVRDLGTGMSLNDLTDCFLVIGTPSRKRDVEKAITKGDLRAPFLGEKGIGRLSAMRLGERLIVQTARKEDSSMNVLDIDWNQFRALDAMVDDIKVIPRTGQAKPNGSWHGTTIIIGDLTEDWSDARVKHLAEYDFVRVSDPFLDAKVRPRIAIIWNGSRIAIPAMDPVLLTHAHARVAGNYTITADGPRLEFTVQALDLGFKHPTDPEPRILALQDLQGAVIGKASALPLGALTSVGPFEFEAYWYSRNRLAKIDGIGDLRQVKEVQRKASGILLYRDSFRVFPYGEDDDDWLALDRKALGRSGYLLNKTQFVGRVNISRMGNPHLVDQTNREGLRICPEQQVFITTLQYIVQELWNHLKQVERRHKSAPLEMKEVRTRVTELEGRAKRAISTLRSIVPRGNSEVLDDLSNAFQELQDILTHARQKIKEVEDNSQRMIEMAGVGLMVEVVAHELARSSEHAIQSLEELKQRKDMPSELKAKLDTLRAEMKTLSKRLRVLDPLSVSGRQRAEVFDLSGVISDLREGHAAQFQRHGIAFEFVGPTAPLQIRSFKGMLIQILENLISNSVYWMGLRAEREKNYRPKITISLQTNPISVSFSDNGPGIAPSNREQVFEYFWSQKEKAQRRGLGLYIARECATYMGGSIDLSDVVLRETGRLHEFILRLPDGVRVR